MLAAAFLAVLATAPLAWPQEAEVERGRELFVTGCSGCHGLEGQGSRNGPPLAASGAAGADFMLSTGRMPLDDPGAGLRRKPPAYAPDEIRAITAYVATLGFGPEIPEVDPADGALAPGATLYSANCAACHSSAGAGGAVGTGLEAPPLERATATEIAEAIRIGPGTMPVFGSETLSDDAVASIVRYLLYLRESTNPGGWGLGRVGPIPEGFVAWALGLGLVLVASRWIGERL